MPIILASGGKLSVINGMLKRNFTLDANTPFRFFYNQGQLFLYNLSLINGAVNTRSGGAVYNDTAGILYTKDTMICNNRAFNGGGIYNVGTIIAMINDMICGNTATGGSGGGILTTGTIQNIINTTISGNTAAVNGGGVHLDSTRINNILGSTFSGNSSSSSGGGLLLVLSTIDNILNSTFANNTSTLGGAIYFSGGGSTQTAINNFGNNTVTSNSASKSKGLFSDER